MLMIHVLATHQNIDTICQRISEEIQRPCYIVTGVYPYTNRDCTYRLPGEQPYRYMTNFEVFMSQWEGFDLCVEKKNGERRFDLREAKVLQVAIPLHPKDLSDNTTPPQPNIFAKHGLTRGLNERNIVGIDPQDTVPEPLKPFVHTYKNRRREDYQGIRFLLSGMFERPTHLREHWHIGTRTEGFSTLQAPGQYAGFTTAVVEEYNRTTIADLDPGPCVVCHGLKGERRHFGVLSMGPNPYMSGHICRGCIDTAFAEIRALMDVEP